MKSAQRLENITDNLGLAVILVLGIAFRLYLATGPTNSDISLWWTTAAQVFSHGQNIYFLTQWNYSPVPFVFFGWLGLIQRAVGIVSFPFLVRAFLTVVDVLTLGVLLAIAGQRHLPQIRTAALFFLNPIAIIITGHHGQIDNIAILFLLLAVYYYGKPKQSKWMRKSLIWLSLTMSLIWKHIVVYQILWFWLRIAKNRWRALLAFGSSVAVFCLLLLPFVRQSPAVVLYRFTIYMGIVGVYGISYILYSICPSCHDSVYLTPWLWLRNIFMVAMLTFSFLYRQKDLARGILVTILFFLCAVSGIGGQYFVLPIAFGALFPTKWFYLYSLVASLFLFGNWDELNIVALQTVNWNTVWMFVLLWFISEMMISIPQLRTWYEKAINWSYRAQG